MHTHVKQTIYCSASLARLLDRYLTFGCGVRHSHPLQVGRALDGVDDGVADSLVEGGVRAILNSPKKKPSCSVRGEGGGYFSCTEDKFATSVFYLTLKSGGWLA